MRIAGPRAPWRGVAAAIAVAAITVGSAAAQDAATTAVQTDAAAAATPPAVAGPLTVELNKFEDGEGGGCRAFFLFRNETGLTLDAFEMSLAILDREGVIDRLLTIDAAPIPVARTTLKLFEIPQTACDGISEILFHDLAACRPQNADEMACFDFIDLVSRTSAPLVK